MVIPHFQEPEGVRTATLIARIKYVLAALFGAMSCEETFL
jgi:hypothetical protein